LKLVKKLKEKAIKLKREIIVIYYAYKNPKTGILPKFIIVITLGYTLSPIDLIPDFIPIIGYLDDLIILPLLLTLSLRLIPDDVLKESREKAVNEPLQLKKNWFTATLFILIWVGLILLIVWKITN
jgi:uncharacterized membrane protein YkvA (DUF1232 family)